MRIDKFMVLKSILCLLFIFSLISCDKKSPLEQKALDKIDKLENLMAEARKKSLDVTREETTLWFSKEFLKFANWDEAHMEDIEKLFGYYAPFEADKKKSAEELPNFERQKVIEILDEGIKNLTGVIDGSIIRRPVSKVDWENIEVAKDMFLSNGKPVFLYDYFSKTVGQPLTNKSVYNDHLGAVYHGGQRLYETNMDRAINPYILNEDGTFNEKIELITEIPDTNVGFMILWNMGMPDWVHQKDPDLTKGRSLFTGFDIDNPLARKVWSDVIQKAGELTKGKKVTQMGYVLSNEPHWYSEKNHWTARFKEMTELSSHTISKFKVWLSKKYNGNISGLNKNWETSFVDFNNVEIEVPIDKALRGKPIWYDWCRYNMDRSVDWFTYLQGELHKVNPDADTSIKIMPNLFSENARSHGIDAESLTELTTMIGDDAKIRERDIRSKEPEEWEEKYSYFWEEMSVAYDFMESVSPNKIHFNSESHFLSASWWRKLDTSSDYVRNTTWLATLHGMDAQIAWFWARDPDGSPEDRLEGELDFFDPALAGSYAGSVNMQPNVANEYTQVMMDLNSFSEEVFALRKQRRPVRLFHSETSAINKKFHMTQQFPMYEALYFEGFPMGYASQKIIEKQNNDNWDAILVYDTEFVTDGEFDALQGYLNNGGTVIVDSKNSLSKNEYGQNREKSLLKGNGSLIMLGKELSVEDIKKEVLETISESLSEVVLTEDNGTHHKGCTWRVVKNPNGGYLVNILNIGAHTAKLNLSLKNGNISSIKNMFTGQILDGNFELKTNGILLLEVK
ncbi:type 1 glutamine amidotransferase family protein [Seonamhaeicola maritimus]|uniref:Glycoside hydrolase family 42 n=1 Tax=Seonamhaeicola maritimus TaxID=2591822 RepID=A0A5C7GE11_9FLAO|nr:glycoside hydrolase family 42 [Seonamhaeicola maritimus]TXG35161.1 glycoside hydrolase family 42 [Seonamhaeicola maritimus]